MLLALVAGFATSATATVFALGEVSDSVRPGTHGAFAGAVVVALTGCIWLDLRYPRGRCFLMRRQTPRHLVVTFPRPIGTFLWGLDTGTMLSTYRSSAATWSGCLLVVAGTAPAWGGAAYAAAFCVPLVASVTAHSRPDNFWVKRFAGDLASDQEQVRRAARRAVALRRCSALVTTIAACAFVANLN